MGRSSSGRSRRASPFQFDQAWDFSTSPSELWAVLSRTGSYREWWPWLRSFDPIPLASGNRARVSIGSPMPFRINVEVEVCDVVPEGRLGVLITGDMQGPARLEIASRPAGSTARLVWDLEPQRPVIRVARRLAPALLRWGHKRVIDKGVEQFRCVINPGPGSEP